MGELLLPVWKPLGIPDHIRPFIWLWAGVNGVGKTTTIGKLAMRYQRENKKVLLAAGDTFRAAAVQQLRTWAERNLKDVLNAQRRYDAQRNSSAT